MMSETATLRDALDILYTAQSSRYGLRRDSNALEFAPCCLLLPFQKWQRLWWLLRLGYDTDAVNRQGDAMVMTCRCKCR